MQNNFEGFFVEINLRKKKWLLSCSYNPTRKNIVNHEKNIGTRLDQFSATYDNLILIGDFNVEPEGRRNFKKFVNIGNEWKKRHKCLMLMLNLKVSKQKRSEASKNKVIIKRVSNISIN